MSKILESTKFVIDNSRFVKINKAQVAEFARKFEHGAATHWLSAAPFGFTRLNDEEKLHFLFIFNALSFSYWGEPKWTVGCDERRYDGAWGMIAALHRAIEEGIPLLDFGYCSTINKTDFAKILRANIEIPLLEERWKILREIGEVTTAKYEGKLGNLIGGANGDARKLLEIIPENFPSFRDSSPYKGKEIYFEKRAQLFVGDTFQFFGVESFGNLKNIDKLTACADYKLPQILRKLGVLEYAAALAEKIDNKIEISHGSEEEVEIRANTIWAVELIKEEVKKRNSTIMSIQINDHLWLATQEKFPGDKPYHRTRTTTY